MINSYTSIREAAFIVGNALLENGINAILTGGSAASIYAPNDYQSLDLDFVLEFASPTMSDKPLIDLGYFRNGYTYEHSSNPITVDFPIGPLAVGDELITKWDTLEENGRKLNVISPTDSTRDRLAAFYFWNDRACLDVAIKIALNQTIDLDLVKTWSQKENSLEAFEFFLQRLERAKSSA